MMETLSLAEHIPVSLASKERKKLLRLLITTVRKQNQARIKAQVSPAGDRWEKRRSKASVAMMRKLRSTKHFKLRAGAAQAATGFTGFTAYIASIHHHGRRQQIGKRNIKYPKRELIGVTNKDIKQLQQTTKDYIQTLNRV